jgi:hypothetical protein
MTAKERLETWLGITELRRLNTELQYRVTALEGQLKHPVAVQTEEEKKPKVRLTAGNWFKWKAKQEADHAGPKLRTE